ncbi:MAG: serine protein kinase RIO [Nanoarchaeota archaeon]
MAKKSKEEWKIYENVFDNFTLNVIYKLMSQKIIEGIQSPIKIGKEANIFSAESSQGKKIVKIYRLECCNFNKMYQYIKSDPRFIDIKKQRRQVIFNWVGREFRNLLAARNSGVRVPTPITHMKNVIILEFIGDKNPAPQLKDMPPRNADAFYEEIIESIRLLYKKGKIVHADISEYNILNYREHPVFIDFSQATNVTDSMALSYLERDLGNLERYFRKLGKEMDAKKVMKEIIK